MKRVTKVINISEHTRKTTGEPQGPLNLGRSYNFIDKHPCIDEIRTWIQNDGRSMNAIANHANISHGCLSNLIYGKTKRPQNATIDMIGKVFGKKRVWVDI